MHRIQQNVGLYSCTPKSNKNEKLTTFRPMKDGVAFQRALSKPLCLLHTADIDKTRQSYLVQSCVVRVGRVN